MRYVTPASPQIPVYVLILLLALACGAPKDDEQHLIPPGYTGPVVIVFGRQDGLPPEYHGRARVYRIPVTGVLRTQFAPQYGSFSADYYYAAGDTVRRQIPAITDAELRTADAGLYVFAIAPGTATVKRPGDSVDTEVHFRSYVVGRLRDADSLGRLAQRQLQALVP